MAGLKLRRDEITTRSGIIHSRRSSTPLENENAVAVETVRIEGLSEVLRTLHQLPQELVSKRGGPVLRALRAAGKVLQAQAQLNVDRIVGQPNKHGIETESIELLRNSILVARGRQPAGTKGETVRVRVKRGAKYPADRQDAGGTVTAWKVGFLLERGTERREPMPWMRPAFDAKKQEAMNTFRTEVLDGIAKAQKKLERQNRVKQ